MTARDRAIRDACRHVRSGALRAGWDPLAALYHYGTREAGIVEPAAAEAFETFLEGRARRDPPPAPFKAPAGRGILLGNRSRAGQFLNTLLARRTWRGFGRSALAREDLGSLLDLTFGYQMTGRTQGGQVLFKTSPSAGACHPIEAYVLAVRVRGLTAGVYHYSPLSGCLHILRRGATPALAAAYLAGQRWCAGASAVVFMTAVMPRVWWRYPRARSYRSILIDVGHIGQTFCLVATWLGLAPFSTMAMDDRRVEEDLGIDGTREILLYAAGVGTKPADERWVQWPGNRPIPRRPRSNSNR